MLATTTISLSQCALGTTKIKAVHTPLQGSAQQRGTIYVKQFTDSRKVDSKVTIGNKRNGFGMVLGTLAIRNSEGVSGFMTEAVADALRASGYQPIIEGQGTASAGMPVLEGDVYEFWMDLFTTTWHNVGVELTLRKPSGAVAWQRKVNGTETNVLWLGLNEEFTKVMRQSIDEAKQEAVKEFSSEAFSAAYRR
ncbi:hypothetical protein WJU23_21610 [Prosthecobacter sp. SYSU 5D2]|uniref:hypothetical protein n=1 Tax=Prosthecobacter sp. SYSU 5D2 TaxID=3134134 RepID=UPI0031FED968